MEQFSLECRKLIGFALLHICNKKQNQNQSPCWHPHKLSMPCDSYMYFLSFDWFTGLSKSLLISKGDYFWFWFKDTQLKNTLHINQAAKNSQLLDNGRPKFACVQQNLNCSKTWCPDGFFFFETRFFVRMNKNLPSS